MQIYQYILIVFNMLTVVMMYYIKKCQNIQVL